MNDRKRWFPAFAGMTMRDGATMRAGTTMRWEATMRGVMVAVLLLAAGCAGASGPSAGPDPSGGAVISEGVLNRTVPPTPGQPPDVGMPPVQRRTLANGLEVWLIEKPEVPLVTVQLVVGAGVIAEPAQQSGIALLTAAMLDEGTRTRTALEIADELDFLAASLSTSASYDAAAVSLSSLSRTLPQALSLFAEVVTQLPRPRVRAGEAGAADCAYPGRGPAVIAGGRAVRTTGVRAVPPVRAGARGDDHIADGHDAR
jgi:hypothetical protein